MAGSQAVTRMEVNQNDLWLRGRYYLEEEAHEVDQVPRPCDSDSGSGPSRKRAARGQCSLQSSRPRSPSREEKGALGAKRQVYNN